MTQQPDPTDRYNRVHIGPDHTTVIEHCTTELADDDPIALALDGIGIVAVSLRFSSGDTLSYSKRVAR